MISAELLRQIRQIQIMTNRAVNEVFAGEYESTFKGQGMQFDEVREYAPGDDIRTIDWNVTARMNRPFIKRYIEEREQTVILAADLSASGAFGSVNKFKNELAAELCAVLAFSAIKNNDKVGLITFTDRIENFIPPKKGPAHVLRVIRELLYHEQGRRGTDIAQALDFLGRVIRKKATVFLISDFIADNFERQVRMINQRHDLIAVIVRDLRERELPPVGLLELEDAETGEITLVDTAGKDRRRQYARITEERNRKVQNIFHLAGVDCINIATDKPYIRELIRFFKMREKRRYK